MLIPHPIRAGSLACFLLALFLLGGCGETKNEPSTATPNSSATAKSHTHSSPNETCFLCDPDKREEGRLWCSEHSRYEDRCWECQPQLEEEGRLYCEEHSLYEDECFLCRPELSTPSAANDGIGPAHSHASPGEACFICNPNEREEGRLWCSEHSRYEDRCWECQPQLEEEGRLYCEEHGLYEDECHLCRPGDGDTGEEDKKSARLQPSHAAPTELQCQEHRVPEAKCGICQPQLSANLAPGEDLKVRFESLQSAAKAGIETVAARETTAQSTVAALCEVSYNQNKLARITPLASGLLKRVLVDVGAEVEEGDLLLELHSPDVANAKAVFISAAVDLNLKEVARRREQRLAEKKLTSDQELQEAEAAWAIAELTLNATRQRLLNYGFNSDEVATISAEQDSSASLLVRAPYDGTIVRRLAVVGEFVEPGDSLLTLANLDTMWLSLSIPADRSYLVEQNLPVLATFDGYVDLEVLGKLTWVNTAIDERTRMLMARAVVDNSSRVLKAGMFGDAQLLLSKTAGAIAVPDGSIQRYERQPYVFVKLEDDLYSLRRVALVENSSSDGYVAVRAGLTANEPVVTAGAFTVMSEFLKSRLGAGCVDD